MKRMVCATLCILGCALLAWADPAGTDAAGSVPAAPQCKVALVSPVSGNAECVDPMGAPVDPPPPRPPQPCPQHLQGLTPQELGCVPASAAPQGR
jgi:hypothetical protein